MSRLTHRAHGLSYHYVNALLEAQDDRKKYYEVACHMLLS